MVFQKNWGERIIFGVFLFLSYFYSAKPFRFKTVPLLDSASNVLYALPGVFAYYQVTGALPPQNVMLAAFLHSSAMHLFSAIPDIEYDRKVNLKTTAVLLGVKVSTFLCLMLWSAFSILAVNIGGFAPLSFLTVVYPALVLTVIVKRMKVISVYWLYPYLNTGLGGLLFLIGAMQTPFR